MVSTLRRAIAEQICRTAKRVARCRTPPTPDSLRSLVKLRADKSCAAPFLAVSVSELAASVGVEAEELRGPVEVDLKKELSRTVLVEAGELAVPLDRTSFLQETLRSPGCMPQLAPSLRLVVDFSSPNVAKPFHVGHLRSTLLGHSLCNLLAFAGHRVTRLNYLGDWGTQCGLLSAGFKRYGSSDELARDPLKHLLSVYVAANAEAERDPTFRAEALQCFADLEAGQPEALAQWEQWRKLSLDGYNQLYGRLGISFDVLDAESRHSQASLDLLERLRAESRLAARGDGVLGIECSEFVPLAKSSGASLYLTRDVVAALERKERYNFDWAYYVVDRSQVEHFRRLSLALEQLGVEWSGRLRHVPFGRIRGVSSRKGVSQGMLLEELLDEAVRRARHAMDQAPTTRVEGEVAAAAVAEQLGLAAVVVNCLRGRRNRDVTFDWHQALHAAGDSGVSLQYAHARLCSIEEKAGFPVDPEVAIDVLQEPCALALAVQVARFEEAVCSAVDQLEPCAVAQHLFSLSHAIGRAAKELPVKNQALPVAQARLLLFHAARVTLGQGMRLLGVQPLAAM